MKSELNLAVQSNNEPSCNCLCQCQGVISSCVHERVRPWSEVTIERRAPSTTTALDSQTVALDAAGQFSFTTNLAPGNYDIAAKASHWFRQNLGDFAGLKAAFGSTQGTGTWNPLADLNGDGSVSLGDFAILRRNYGQQGDPQVLLAGRNVS